MSALAESELQRPTRARLLDIAAHRFEQSTVVPTRFFDAHADVIPDACLEMARRFHRGGRLLVFGEGAEATDAQHVAVEFVHPVIVGKRALPALSLASDVAALTGLGRMAPTGGGAFARTLEVLGRESDIAMGISRGGRDAPALAALTRARELGMLTVALSGGMDAEIPTAIRADFVFVVPSADPMVVQEVHETLYHVLWELVHVFFEHQVVR